MSRTSSKKSMKIKISPPKELSIEIPPDEYVQFHSKSEVHDVDQKLEMIEE